MPEALVPAPRWRRLAAGVIDVSGGIGAGALPLLVAEWRGHGAGQSDALSRLSQGLSTPRARRAIDTAALAMNIHARGRRSRGQRALGLRTVDARTGGPIGTRAVVTEALAQQLVVSSILECGEPARARARERAEALRPVLEQIQERDRDDPEARAREMNEAYRSAGVGVVGCLPMIAPLLVGPLSAAVAPTGQTIYQRLAGIQVVGA